VAGVLDPATLGIGVPRKVLMTVSDMPNVRRQILLAVAIIEWDGALLHLRALNHVGAVKNQTDFDLNYSAVQRELDGWIRQWPNAAVLSHSDVLSKARAFLGRHEEELRELLEGV
jgi:hypothetical protein